MFAVMKLKMDLELNHLTLAFLITTQFEMLATLQWCLFTVFAFSTFHTEYNFFCCLGLKRTKIVNKNIVNFGNQMIYSNLIICALDIYLLSEDGLSLTTETLLFSVVTTSTLSCLTFLRFLVLCHFMQFVAFAFFAESAALFWYIHLKKNHKNSIRSLQNNFYFVLFQSKVFHKYTKQNECKVTKFNNCADYYLYLIEFSKIIVNFQKRNVSVTLEKL